MGRLAQTLGLRISDFALANMPNTKESMEPKDWIVIGATIMGPILAVQAQKALETIRERQNRKMNLFTQLMATRAARLSAAHVQALNLIDIVFFGDSIYGFRRRSSKEQAVLDAWKEYHDNLGEGADMPEMQQQAHYSKRNELFLNLVHAMSQDVGFKFDRVQLKRGAYSPMAHEELEEDQRAMRKAMIGALTGGSSLQMNIVGMPVNEAQAESFRLNVERIATALELAAASKAETQLPQSQRSEV